MNSSVGYTHTYIIYIFSENKVGRASEVRDQKGVEGGSKGWVMNSCIYRIKEK